MIWHVTVDGSSVTVDLSKEPSASLTPLGENRHLLSLDGTSWILLAEEGAISLGDLRLEVSVESALERRLAALRGKGDAASSRGPETVKAPMPGIVSRVEVSAGQAVKTGDLLLVLEAMKMANEVRARGPGRILSLSVSAGQAVTAGEGLLTLG